ncbi:MAG: ABC transporter permease subunit [Clostridiales bacterium]|nr:ABC transporter permease subunit [Clostridiales bacterium]
MRRQFTKKLFQYRFLLLMLAPAVIYTIVFAYIPMGGVILAFKDYNYRDGIFNSPWAGFQNFKFFLNSGQAFKVTRNTLLYNAMFIIINTFMQITIAILLSEMRSRFFKRFAQSMMFLPYFISWVIVSMIAFNLLSYDYGFINSIISSLGFEKINFYASPPLWIPILAFFSFWKGVGYGTVMYLAAIMGIDATIYEAAQIDGANVFQRILKITLPSLMPTIVILLLLSIGGIFRSNFDMFYQLIGNNGPLFNYTDVIDTFTFRALITSNDVGMASASGLYQSVFCFATILIANFLVKRYDSDYSLF